MKKTVAFGLGFMVISHAVAVETIDVAPTGPVSTPAAAVAAARQLRAEGKVPADETIEIRLKAGVYELTEPLRLESSDSHLVFVCPDGVAEITHGHALGRFTADAKGLWHLKVPGKLAFDQLSVNGRRATVARSPNREYYFMRETVYEWKDRFGELHNMEKMAFLADNKDDLAALAAEPYEKIGNARIHVFWAWDSDFIALKDVIADKGVCILDNPAKLDFFRWPKYQTRYVLENFRGALDEPGEWFFDTDASEILYLPRKGEKVETARAEIPTGDRVLEIRGTAQDRVKDVTFRNVAFGMTGFKFSKRFIGTQSAFQVPGAVRVSFADGVRFVSCRFGKCAGYALDFEHAVRNCEVRSSVFKDLGAGGVKIGSRRWKPEVPDDEVCEKVTIDDNVLLEGGRIFTEGTGVLLAFARKCEITHNEIKDFYYNGVSVGWTWGYGPTCVRDNAVTWNHIRDIGQAVQCDMAGIYTLGNNTGSLVMGNVIHDVYGWDYTGHGCEGLYTDEGSVGLVLVSNLVYRTKGSSYNHHYGNDMVVRNNILYGAHDPDGTTRVITLGQPWGRHGKEPEGHPAMTVGANILVGGAGSNMTSEPSFRKNQPYPVPHYYRFGTNLWWSVDGLAATNRFSRGIKTFAQWQADGFDAGSVFADPLFVDARNGNFRLKKGSPAFRLGFREWDYTKAGARTGELRRLAKNHRTPPLRKPKAPKPYLGAASFETSFEPCRTGARPGGFQLMEGEKIAVTEETARRGKKSVKIVDIDKKQSRGYLPHLPAKFFAGTGDSFEFSISLKFDEQCDFDIEFREETSRAKGAEPFFRLSHIDVKDGRMTSTRGAKDALKSIRPGVWYDLSWTFRFREDSTVYDLTVVSETGERIVMRDQPTNDRGPCRPNWFGFMSYGHKNGVAYLDDMRWGAPAGK